MSVVDTLTITPVSIANYPRQLINNWDRKVDIETAYMTMVSTMADGTERRKGIKVRPRRFIYSRLTAMTDDQMAQLEAFLMRISNQTVPVPVYADITSVSFEGDMFQGDFSNTRFFQGARVLHFNISCGEVLGMAYYTVDAVCDNFVSVNATVVSQGPGADLLVPLIDTDIELQSIRYNMHTDAKASVDLNVNERKDESALIPLTTISRTTVLEDDFNTLVPSLINWPTQVGTPEIIEQDLVLEDGDSVTSASLATPGEYQIDLSYALGTGVSTFVATVNMTGNIVEITRTQSQYVIKVNAVQVGSSPITTRSDNICIFRKSDESSLAIVANSCIVAYLTSGISGVLNTVELAAGTPGTVNVHEIGIYDEGSRVYKISPTYYRGTPILDADHNWMGDPSVDITRFGTRAEFGRGRLVDVDSVYPQRTWNVKTLFNRQQAFEFLRFFDFARGRLVPFWYVNLQRLWTVTGLRTGEVLIKGVTETAEDVTDFYKYMSLDGTILQITGAYSEGNNFVLQTPDFFDVGSPATSLTSAHLVRFAKDSIREVWTNREVCEIAFDMLEVLEDVDTDPEGIWGGLPDESTDQFVSGGFPDTVYVLNGYAGGSP